MAGRLLVPRARLDLSTLNFSELVQREAADKLINTSALMDQLIGLGCDLIDFCSVEIQVSPELTAAKFKQQLEEKLAKSDIAIFVSRHSAFLACHFFELDKLSEINCIAVGESTANILRQNNIAVEVAMPQNSKGVLLMPQMQNLKGKKVLIFKGQGGLDIIEKASESAGATVSNIELFERIVATDSDRTLLDILDADVNETVILAVSVSVLKMLKDNLREKNQALQWDRLHDRKLVALSERIAAFAKDEGFKEVLVADSGATDIVARSIKNLATL